MAPISIDASRIEEYLERYHVPRVFCSRTTVAVVGGFAVMTILVAIFHALMVHACAGDEGEDRASGGNHSEKDIGRPTYHDYVDEDGMGDDTYYDYDSEEGDEYDEDNDAAWEDDEEEDDEDDDDLYDDETYQDEKGAVFAVHERRVFEYPEGQLHARWQ